MLTLDAGDDAGADTSDDAGIDAGVDAGADVGADAGVDAGDDTGVEAGVDAGDVSLLYFSLNPGRGFHKRLIKTVSTEMLYKVNTLQVESTTPFPEPFQTWILAESTWPQDTEKSPTLGQAAGVGWTGGTGVRSAPFCIHTVHAHTHLCAHTYSHPRRQLCTQGTLTCTPTHMRTCTLTPHLSPGKS